LSYPERLADPVAPAKRSPAALAKVHTRTLAHGDADELQ
jgi:hypothetical protein